MKQTLHLKVMPPLVAALKYCSAHNLVIPFGNGRQNLSFALNSSKGGVSVVRQACPERSRRAHHERH